MNDIIKSNNAKTIENDVWKVFFNKVNFEGKLYNLTIAVDKKDNNLYFFPSEVGEILGFENLGHNLAYHYEINIDYIKLKDDKLLKLKDLINNSTNNAEPFSKFAPEIKLLTESGLYAVIFKSRKKVAKQFRIKVTSEILPMIRRSGGYLEGFTEEEIRYIRENKEEIKEFITDAKLKSLRIREVVKILKEANFDETDIQAATLHFIKQEGLLDVDDKTIRRLSPILEEDEYNATDLAEKLGLGRTRKGSIKVNQLLAKLGLQEKTSGKWRPTEEGLRYIVKRRVPRKYDKAGRSIEVYYWKASVIDLLKQELLNE